MRIAIAITTAAACENTSANSTAKFSMNFNVPPRPSCANASAGQNNACAIHISVGKPNTSGHRHAVEAQAKAAIHARAVMPRERLSAAIHEHRAMLAKSSGADPAAPLAIAGNSDDIMIVVAGGVGIKAAYLPTWSGGTRAVSVKIR